MTTQGISSTASASNILEVKILNNQRHQQEVVVGEILQGIEDTNAHTNNTYKGQHIDIKV